MNNSKNNQFRSLRRNTVSTGILICLAAVATQQAHADTWDFDFLADVGTIWTDNLFLAGEGLEQNETVFSIAPEFTWVANGQRIPDADIRYRPEAFFYSDNSDFNEVFHTLDANLTLALVNNALFTYFSAVNFQSIVSPEGTLWTSNVPVTGNRVDSTILEIRPFWEQSFNFADVYLELAYIDTEYEDADILLPNADLTQPSNTRRARFELGNESRMRGLIWETEYEFRRLEYDIGAPWEYQYSTLNLGYWVSGGLRLFGTGGLETPIDEFDNSDMSSELWEAGFQYRPGERLDFEVAAGQRSYGDSFRGRFAYQMRRGEFLLTYNEAPMTRGEVPQGRRPIADIDSLDLGTFDRPGRSDRFVSKRSELSNTLNLSKSTLELRIFHEERVNRTTANGTPLPDEEFTGAVLRWNWQAGSRSAIGFGGDYSKRVQEVGTDDLTRLSVDFTYRLSQKISLRMEGWHSVRGSADIANLEYEENQVRLLFRFNI